MRPLPHISLLGRGPCTTPPLSQEGGGAFGGKAAACVTLSPWNLGANPDTPPHLPHAGRLALFLERAALPPDGAGEAGDRDIPRRGGHR